MYATRKINLQGKRKQVALNTRIAKTLKIRDKLRLETLVEY